MSKWITIDVVAALATIPEVSILRKDGGEDITTQSLTLAVANSQNHVYVRGFTTNSSKPLKSDDNVDIEMVEVSTGYSDGDMPNDPDYVVAHAKVSAAVMRLGHRVVNSLDRFF